MRLARRTLRLLARRGADVGAVEIDPGALRVVEGFMGAGYGHPTEAAREAGRLAADRAGLALEPVYTSKALAALLADAGREGPAVFWNTHSGVAPD
jgi:D-cysteine desulfhydrase